MYNVKGYISYGRRDVHGTCIATSIEVKFELLRNTIYYVPTQIVRLNDFEPLRCITLVRNRQAFQIVEALFCLLIWIKLKI